MIIPECLLVYFMYSVCDITLSYNDGYLNKSDLTFASNFYPYYIDKYFKFVNINFQNPEAHLSDI